MTVTSHSEIVAERADAPVNDRVTRRLRVTAHALSFRNISALYIFVLLFIVFSVWEPDTFLTAQTWQLMLDNQAVTAMVAVGLIIPLSAGITDLAVGTEVGLAAIVVAWLLSEQGLSVPLAVGLTLAVGALLGLVMSLLIVRVRIPSIIATLGVSSVLLGVINGLAGSQQILNLGSSFQKLATGKILGVTYPVYILAVVALVVWYFLERTPWGRRVHATGGNIEAARLAGVQTTRVIVISVTACAVISSIAGTLESSRLATGDPTISQSYLLPAFAAAFLGSTQFRGGRFNVFGTLVAVAVLAVGVQGLELAGAPVWLPDLFNGVALLLAVGFAQLQRSSTGRFATIRRMMSFRGTPGATENSVGR